MPVSSTLKDHEEEVFRMLTETDRHLVVAHYHLRPGGVRRVIESALPYIVGKLGIKSVTLAVGERPERGWLEGVRTSLGKVTLQIEEDREFLYWSERGKESEDEGLCERLTERCERVLERPGGEKAILWAHNLGLGRNVPLSSAWAQAAERTGAVFLSHHHDFYFDNRWQRWSEIVAAGFGEKEKVAKAIFPLGRRTIHLSINRADYELLAAGFGKRAMWVPNPVVLSQKESGGEEEAEAWLAKHTGSDAPYWLIPCRLLRRKNLAEGLLLARWLRTGVRVVTTGGATSNDEVRYYARLREEAETNGWPLDLGVLAGQQQAPTVSQLMQSAEAILLTSLQEGFGLPYVEAAAEERPLIARALPNVYPDLVAWGLRSTVAYNDVSIPCDFFDIGKEIERQRKLFTSWVEAIPASARGLIGEPALLAGAGDVVPFSRLTLSAQIEILKKDPRETASALRAANAELSAWSGEKLPPAKFEQSAKAMLSPERFAENFKEAVERAVNEEETWDNTAERVLHEFLKDRLRSDNLYPLVMGRDT